MPLLLTNSIPSTSSIVSYSPFGYSIFTVNVSPSTLISNSSFPESILFNKPPTCAGVNPSAAASIGSMVALITGAALSSEVVIFDTSFLFSNSFTILSFTSFNSL